MLNMTRKERFTSMRQRRAAETEAKRSLVRALTLLRRLDYCEYQITDTVESVRKSYVGWF